MYDAISREACKKVQNIFLVILINILQVKKIPSLLIQNIFDMKVKK